MANTTNRGVFPVDATTDVGRVRILVGDTDPDDINGAQGSQTGSYFWYSDDELTSLLDTLGMDAAHGAIYVLRMVAATPAMQLKKWQSADLAIDGPAITTALRGLINDIEKSIGVAASAEAESYFGVVNTGPAMPQPALFPRHVPSRNDVPFDPTLPIGYPYGSGRGLI